MTVETNGFLQLLENHLQKSHLFLPSKEGAANWSSDFWDSKKSIKKLFCKKIFFSPYFRLQVRFLEREIFRPALPSTFLAVLTKVARDFLFQHFLGRLPSFSLGNLELPFSVK